MQKLLKNLGGMIFKLLLCAAMFAVACLWSAYAPPPVQADGLFVMADTYPADELLPETDLPPETADTPDIDYIKDTDDIGDKKEAPSAVPPSETENKPPLPDIGAKRGRRIRGRATIGFVGDILIMASQIDAAKQADGTYDFSESFLSMRPVFEAADLVVANLEIPLAGAAAGYSRPQEAAPEPTEENPNPQRPLPSFNAPDALAGNLRDAGIHVLTTANNHCLDRGLEGMFRTIETVRAAGLRQTGTFLSEEDRAQRLIIDVNGIKVGILAYAGGFNGNSGLIKGQEHLIAAIDRRAEVVNDINACRDAGAEFIIVCAHWGDEYIDNHNAAQENTAAWLAQNGADIIIGTHPHVVQEIVWIEAERGDETVRVPVIYSLGNFIGSTTPQTSEYGAYVQAEIARKNGRVEVESIYYLPIYRLRRRLDNRRTLLETVPCYENAAPEDSALAPLDETSLRRMEKCRAHVAGIIGNEYAAPITSPPAK